MVKLNPSQNLWDFALALYAQPQVAETCLHLQDKYGANVCLLIGMCWLDAREHQLTQADFFALKTRVEGWTHHIVEPLRSLRRKLKLPHEDFTQDETHIQLRNTVKQAELLAEKKLLMEIEKWVSENSQVATTKISKNFPHYNFLRYSDELKMPQEMVRAISNSI